MIHHVNKRKTSTESNENETSPVLFVRVGDPKKVGCKKQVYRWGLIPIEEGFLKIYRAAASKQEVTTITWNSGGGMEPVRLPVMHTGPHR